MLRLLTDENFNADILRGLVRRCRTLDVVRVQSVGLTSAPDSVILAWAETEKRVLLSHDRDTIPHWAFERVRSGASFSGVVLVSDLAPIGRVIEDLLIVVECLSEEEVRDQIIFVPL